MNRKKGAVVVLFVMIFAIIVGTRSNIMLSMLESDSIIIFDLLEQKEFKVNYETLMGTERESSFYTKKDLNLDMSKWTPKCELTFYKDDKKQASVIIYTTNVFPFDNKVLISEEEKFLFKFKGNYAIAELDDSSFIFRKKYYAKLSQDVYDNLTQLIAN